MKPTKTSAIFAAAFVCALAVSCEVTVTNIRTYDVSGTAVDVQADRNSTTWSSALSGAVVTLRDTTSAKVYTTTVSSSGRFGWDGLPVGEYRMAATKTGWAFVPKFVELTGKTAVLPDLLGYEYDTDTIYIITEWENEDVDVDSSLYIDDDNIYEDSFDGLGEVDTVDVNDKIATGVELDRDITPADIADGLPAVETISITSNPFAGSDNSGWLKFYLTAAGGKLTGNSSADIADARATVHVMQGTTHFGTFPVATETQETTLLVVAIFAEPNAGNPALTDYTIGSAGNFGGLLSVH